MKFRLRYTLFVEILRFLKFFLGDFCESSNSRRQSHKVYRSRAFSRKMLIWLGLKFDEELKLYCDMMMCILIKCISTKENTYYLNLFAYRTEVVTVLYARQFNSLDAILDRPATFCLNLIFSFSHQGAVIYFVTLIRSQMKRWQFSVYYRFAYSFSRSFQLIQSVFLLAWISSDYFESLLLPQ